jgi:uncharacterized phage infection (PIP) family protein YhgE
MHSSTKRVSVLGLLMAGLLLFATACGGSSSKSSSSTTTANSSATTASAGSGGDAGNCTDLYTKFNTVGDNIINAMTGTGGTTDWNTVISQLNALTSSVPSEVRGDWQTLVNGVTQLATALNGVNVANSTDPAVAAQMTAAMSAFDSAAMSTAEANLNAYFKNLCPSLADK